MGALTGHVGSDGLLLDAHVVVRHPGLHLDLTLRAAPGTVIALLGPNGAGKTTLLQALAGLMPLSDGHITVQGRVWADASGALEPRRRSCGLLAADHLLFPHLDALRNVAFGPHARGADIETAAHRAHQELAALHIDDLSQRRPGQLSHGQNQRVALARALATDPLLLLLDEPFSDLDPQVRPSIRADLAARLRTFTGVTILVTHDPLDALTLGDHLVFLRDGAVIQEGPPHTIVEHPRDRYVAEVAGLNLFEGTTAAPDAVELASGAHLVTTDHDHRGATWVAFAPSAVSLFPQRPDGSPRNAWLMQVEAVELTGQTARIRLDGTVPLVADITVAALAALRLGTGDEVWATVKATEIRTYPA